MDKQAINKNVLHCELTPLQEEYLPAIEWLVNVDSYRAQGRTYTMAVAFIKVAMKRPGVKVEVWDHYFRDRELGQRRMMDMVGMILNMPENKEILKRTRFYRDGFSISGVWKKEVVAE